eukprot:scaffold12728_cov57-Phaeocystis_antarctica.AAC.2
MHLRKPIEGVKFRTCTDLALRRSELKQPLRLCQVLRSAPCSAGGLVVHLVVHLAVALPCGELTQPLPLGKVPRPALSVAVHATEHSLRPGNALRCSEPKEPPRLCKVLRPALAVIVHQAERSLRCGVALHCSEPIQPPRLGKVFRPSLAVNVHTADCSQGIRVALLCSEPIQPPRLCKVLRLTFAGEVHAAEQCLRVGIALLYSKANPPPLFARRHASSPAAAPTVHKFHAQGVNHRACTKIAKNITASTTIPHCSAMKLWSRLELTHIRPRWGLEHLQLPRDLAEHLLHVQQLLGIVPVQARRGERAQVLALRLRVHAGRVVVRVLAGRRSDRRFAVHLRRGCAVGLVLRLAALVLLAALHRPAVRRGHRGEQVSPGSRPP